jgi:hypothetical protein
MRRAAYTLFFILTCLLTSCGVSKGHFKLEGRILHINQGELYVYSLDGGTIGMDTIKIQGGRFAYEIPSEGKSHIDARFPPIFPSSLFSPNPESPLRSVLMRPN